MKIPHQFHVLKNLGLRDIVAYKFADPWYGLLSRLGLSAPGKTYSLHVRGDRWPVHLRANSSDGSAFRMIYIDHEYGALDGLDDVKLIVDCGANAGFASTYFLNRYPQAHVIAVEPDDRNVEMLRRNLQPYGNRTTIYATGVWSHTTGLVVSKGQHGDQKEWSTQVRECRADEIADIQAMDLQTILQQSGFDVIDLLKVDIERSEAEVFSQNYETWLNQTRNIVIELHDDDCERVFFQALSPYTYALSRFGEVTICQALQPAAGGVPPK